MNAPVREELLDVALAGPLAVERSRMTRIELGPGQPAGLHRHPCDVVGYVLAGTIRFQVAGRPEVLLHAGEAFHEPRDARIPHFDNASDTEPAIFLACYLLGPDQDQVIEMLAGGAAAPGT